MGVGESADLPESVVIEMRRTAAELLGNVSSYADNMLDYILERVPEAGVDDDLRGLTLKPTPAHNASAASPDLLLQDMCQASQVNGLPPL